MTIIIITTVMVTMVTDITVVIQVFTEATQVATILLTDMAAIITANKTTKPRKGQRIKFHLNANLI